MAGVTIGMQEEVIALTPVLLLFGRSLGFDVFTILCMTYGSTVVGSAFWSFKRASAVHFRGTYDVFPYCSAFPYSKLFRAGDNDHAGFGTAVGFDRAF